MLNPYNAITIEAKLSSPTPCLQVIAPSDDLPGIPSMISTRLHLGGLLRAPAIDLRAASDAILSDAGATTQVLRLMADEFPGEQSGDTLMHDCIASLGFRRCYEAICSSDAVEMHAVLHLLEHFRRVAECARNLASCIDGISPDEAYLVGLLYRIGEVAGALGWEDDSPAMREEMSFGIALAERWQLPDCVRNAMQQRRERTSGSYWIEILEVAELLAARKDVGLFHSA